MIKKIKHILKKTIPLVVLKNIRGFVSAASSYYPVYLFGAGKINLLKKVSIEVTFRCNCRCLMCPLYGIHTHRGREIMKSIHENNELTINEFKKIFNELKKFGTESINFTGGEAFLRKDILEIITLAKQSGFHVSVTTNGGLITKEIAKELVKTGIDSITISLDGPKETHNHIRQTPVFDHIMNSVDWINMEKQLQKKSAPDIDFLCTVSALNQGHLSKLVKIAHNKGLPLNIDPIIFATQEDTDNTSKVFHNSFIKKESFVMPENIGKINIDILENELKKVFRTAKKLIQPVYISLASRKTRKKFFYDSNYTIINKCLVPWYNARIDPYGNIYPCSLSISMGNVREKNLLEIINGEKFVEFRKKLKKQGLFPICKKCCSLYSNNIFWNLLPKL